MRPEAAGMQGSSVPASRGRDLRRRSYYRGASAVIRGPDSNVGSGTSDREAGKLEHVCAGDGRLPVRTQGYPRARGDQSPFWCEGVSLLTASGAPAVILLV